VIAASTNARIASAANNAAYLVPRSKGLMGFSFRTNADGCVPFSCCLVPTYAR
jgi:hypothetical protein